MKIDSIIQIDVDSDDPSSCQVRVLSRGRFIVNMQRETKDVAVGDRFNTMMNGSLASSCKCKVGEAFDNVTEMIVEHLNRVKEKETD